MADTKIVEMGTRAPTGRPIKDFDPELSAAFNEAFPGDEFERLFHEHAGRIGGRGAEEPLDA